MTFILIDICINVHIRKRALSNQSTQLNKYKEIQMFILMLSSIVIFVITTVPIFVYTIIAPRELYSLDFSTTLITITILNWTKSLNYSVSFKYYQKEEFILYLV
jgi:hypothetical protein